jgi:holin-like protein
MYTWFKGEMAMTQAIKGISQMIILFLLSLVINKFVDWVNLKIPGTILGIIIVFLLLQTRVIRLEWIETGANWLLGNLMLFLIPSAVGIVQYTNILSENGLSLIAVLVIGSIIVMALTGLFAQNFSIGKRKG